MTETKMSSEEETRDLTQEATDASADTPAKTEPTVPLHEVTALRTRAQEAEAIAQQNAIDLATAQGELNALRNKPTATSKSPLEIEIERQAAEGLTEDEMTVSPVVVRAEAVYQRQIDEQAAQTRTRAEIASVQTKSVKKATAKYSDYKAVTNQGEVLLTRGELVDIASETDNFGEIAYAKCKAAIERFAPAKPETKPEVIADAAPNKNQSESVVVPTQQEILKGVDPATALAAQL